MIILMLFIRRNLRLKILEFDEDGKLSHDSYDKCKDLDLLMVNFPYSPIHAEGILDVRLAVCTSHIGARKCADHESHLIILKTSAP